MIYRVVVTPTADTEAMGAFRWYAERSVPAAERWYDGLNAALASLTDRPGRFPVSEEDSAALGCEIRTLLHGKRPGVYRILYTIRDDTVTVLRIRHAAQGPL